MSMHYAFRALAAISAQALTCAAHAALVFVGPATSTAPIYLPPPPANAFLLPVQIAGADRLQNWQFDLLFDPAVVNEVDPLDGSGGIYGARFVSADADSTAFILGGFALNGAGLVDDIAGIYPALFDGVSGDGVLAFVLFEFVPGREADDPGFRIADADPPTLPEPSSAGLLAIGLFALTVSRRQRAGQAGRRPWQGRATLLAGITYLAGATIAAPAFAAETVANGPYYAVPSWDQTLPAATRFIVLSNMGGDAVLDRETALVWEKAPRAVQSNWPLAQNHCRELILGNRAGWRLPTLQELQSLLDPAAMSVPKLPAAHPFVGVAADDYWSASSAESSPLVAFGLNLNLGNVVATQKRNQLVNLFAWCVRGGQGVDPQ